MRGVLVSGRGWRRSLAAAVILVVVAAVVAHVQSASATTTTLRTFTTAGTYTWKVPTGVTNVTFTVYGASGGGVYDVLPGPIVNVISDGGLGGEAKGKFTVHAGEVFEIVVGGQGGGSTNNSGGAAGFNGGGPGFGSGGSGGGGGGASDVRIGGRANACASAKSCGFVDRIVVAGGGGGGSEVSNGDNGGDVTGGGLACSQSASGSSAGQECVGAWVRCGTTGVVPPGFGQGGDGCDQNSDDTGAGGGGWYGGGNEGSGGGGSGYINLFSLGGSFPGGTNTGDGKVIITTTT